MTTVYLIRHAEADGNLYRRAHGHYDAAITDNGYRQIAALAKRFENTRVDAVYASDLTRTRTTALAITRLHGLPLQPDARLRETGIGEWEDKTWAWLARFDRERLVAFNSDAGRWHVDGGEDMTAVRARVTEALRDIVAANPNRTVAVFSHGMVLRLLIGTLRGLSIAEIDRTHHGENTAVTKLEADEGGVRVVYAIDHSHLSDELTTLHKQVWVKNPDGIEPGVWFAPDKSAAGRFDAMSEDTRVGTVAVRPLGGGVAALEAFRLDDALRRQGFEARLLGQAVSHARTLGCDTLRMTLPEGDADAARRAAELGFRAAGERAAEKYIGRDEQYRAARFDEAWASLNEKA